MSDQHPNHDDGDLAATAQHVTDALHRHADGIEPGHDAYARLAARVNDAGTQPAGGLGSWFPTPRLAGAVAAAAVVLVGGVALVNVGRGDDSVGTASVVTEEPTTSLQSAAGDATDPSVAGADDGADDDSLDNGDDEDGPDSTDEVIANGGRVVPLAGGIARESRAEAATAFLNHLGVDNVSVTVSDDQAFVRSEREGGGEGPEIAVLQLAPVAIDDVDRWVVVGATSGDIVIDTPSVDSEVSGDALTVSGQGTGFEATVEVELRSATDGRQLSIVGTGAGNFGDLAPFSSSIPLSGTDQAWVIVRSSGGADDVATSFAAVPITFIGSIDDTSYHVVRIDDDDPDGGLNLRVGPGSDTDVLAVLDQGAVVTRTVDALPTRNGSSVWWPVTAADGTVGWAASQFLAAAGTLSDQALADAAEQFLFVASNPEVAGPWIDVAPRLGFAVVAGGNQVEVAATGLQRPDGWTAPLPGLGGRSLAELADVPSDFETAQAVDVNGSANVAPSAAGLLARYFGALPYVTVTYTATDGGTRNAHVVFEAAPIGAPAIVGVVFP